MSIENEDVCWPWSGTRDRKGYGVIRLAGGQFKAHRVTWAAFRGPIPDGMCVCHHCDNPGCINPKHLFLGTIGDNNRDMMQKGRHRWGDRPKGERHVHAVLTASLVREIRRRYVPRHPTNGGAALAREYCLSKHTLYSALPGGRNWKWL